MTSRSGTTCAGCQLAAVDLIERDERGAPRARSGRLSIPPAVDAASPISMSAYVNECSRTRSTGRCRRLEEARNRAGVADAPERLGGRALDGGSAGLQRGHELRHRRRVAPQPGGMDRRLPHAVVAIAERQAHHLARPRALDARQGPDRVAARLDGRRRADDLRERGNGRVANLRELPQGPLLHRRPRVVQQLREVRPASSRSRRASGRAGRRPPARPCGARDRSRRARPAWRAARSGSRACTSRRCRRRAGCRRRLRARRSDGSRGCRRRGSRRRGS